MESNQVLDKEVGLTILLRILRNSNLALHPITKTSHLKHGALSRTLWTQNQINALEFYRYRFDRTKVMDYQLLHFALGGFAILFYYFMVV